MRQDRGRYLVADPFQAPSAAAHGEGVLRRGSAAVTTPQSAVHPVTGSGNNAGPPSGGYSPAVTGSLWAKPSSSSGHGPPDRRFGEPSASSGHGPPERQAAPQSGLWGWASTLMGGDEEPPPLQPYAGAAGGAANGLTGSHGPQAARAQAPADRTCREAGNGQESHRRFEVKPQKPPANMQQDAHQFRRGMNVPGPPAISLEERWPSEVLSHIGMAPQGIGTRPCNSRTRDPATSGLRLVAGACQIPHPNKADFGGEDSYFIAADGSAMGVADGVGEWERLGQSTRPMADELMAGTSLAAEELVAAGPEHPGERAKLSLRRGFSTVHSFGACTANIAVLDSQGQYVGVANVGDSGLRQIRKMNPSGTANARVVNCTRDQQHFFNCPFQLTKRPYAKDYPLLLAQGKKKLVEVMQSNIKMVEDSPDDADVYAFPLTEGDVLILGSDGLFDNLHDAEICDFIDLSITPMEARQVFVESAGTLRGPGSSSDPGALATTIAHAAYHRACDTTAATPFSACAQSQGIAHRGGKLDDITVICAWVVRMAV